MLCARSIKPFDGAARAADAGPMGIECREGLALGCAGTVERSTVDHTGPKCAGPMVVVERLTAAHIQLRSPPLVTAAA